MVVDDMASIPARNRQFMRLQPNRVPTPVPNAIIQKIMVRAAMTGAIPIFKIFLNEKSRPSENNKNITPISAHVCISALSTTDIRYGICGLTRNPATIYPNTNGWRSFLNNKVTRPATIRISARSCIKWGISAIYF